MSRVPYRKLVGCLIYLAGATIPDIAFATNILSRYNNNPGKLHWIAAKRVLRYLKGTKECGITYQKSDCKVEAFADADWGGDVDDRHSTSGYIIMFGDSPISWKCKKQNSVALSSAEAEYTALALAAKEVIWRLLEEVGIKLEKAITLYSDSTSGIAMSKNPVRHEMSKHIEMKVHFIREMVEKDLISVIYVPTESQLADIFTKALREPRFNMLKNRIHVQDND